MSLGPPTSFVASRMRILEKPDPVGVPEKSLSFGLILLHYMNCFARDETSCIQGVLA